MRPHPALRATFPPLRTGEGFDVRTAYGVRKQCLHIMKEAYNRIKSGEKMEESYSHDER